MHMQCWLCARCARECSATTCYAPSGLVHRNRTRPPVGSWVRRLRVHQLESDPLSEQLFELHDGVIMTFQLCAVKLTRIRDTRRSNHVAGSRCVSAPSVTLDLGGPVLGSLGAHTLVRVPQSGPRFRLPLDLN